jgi:hypothetical protein
MKNPPSYFEATIFMVVILLFAFLGVVSAGDPQHAAKKQHVKEETLVFAQVVSLLKKIKFL